jgi:peptide/nickel transport system permease protein
MSIPTLLLIVFVSVVGPPRLRHRVIGLLGWPHKHAGLRKGLALRDSECVTAAGGSTIPSSVRECCQTSSHTVLATFGVAEAILLEATLSFLGLGVQPPEPSLGNMIFEAQDSNVLFQVPWLWLSPGVLIAVTVLAVNFVGDGLRDALDPRSTRRH